MPTSLSPKPKFAAQFSYLDEATAGVVQKSFSFPERFARRAKRLKNLRGFKCVSV